MTVPTYVPVQTSVELTRAMVAAPDLPAVVSDCLHTAWAVTPERGALMRCLPRGFLEDLLAAASTPEGLAALKAEVGAVPPREVARHVHLLTSDPGRTVTLATLAQSEIDAEGYLPQLLELGEIGVDDQGRISAAANAAEIVFGPLLPSGAAVSVTHVAVTLAASDGSGRVVSVIELTDPHEVHAGESVSIRAGALSCGVG
ncbi:hypothetical protein ADL22_12420 [Streptomyces sp. NRRL F-4489]|uniref:phage tail fiber protein n=1 Tax=Streptomyces sp. NRRL F-4489 TaxID=1609095 RepID=UPI000747DA72|nr:hypothetical protein [Streptomyces sp. NRRL F-4489]KUL44742.1 hypothetical protein ADL22_12420 [Streptomyces sp. NRRL F-4489]